MSDLMKGNFETQKKVSAEQQDEDLESRFEREAMKKLGGSKCGQRYPWDRRCVKVLTRWEARGECRR